MNGATSYYLTLKPWLCRACRGTEQ